MPLDVDKLRSGLPQNPIHYFPVTGSTMTEGASLAAQAPHGSLIVAEQQTAGIGRLGRSWTSPPELGIYCSVLLRLPLPPAQLPVASLLLGLAVGEAIQHCTHLVCDVRWPNDVLLNEKKVCGILIQLVDCCIVAGIGINVNQIEFEPGLRTPATSLRLESGRMQSREDLLIALMRSIDTYCQVLSLDGPVAVIRLFSALSSYANGRQVSVEDSGLQGVTAGLDESGFLMLRTTDGQLHRLSAGGVRATKR